MRFAPRRSARSASFICFLLLSERDQGSKRDLIRNGVPEPEEWRSRRSEIFPVQEPTEAYSGHFPVNNLQCLLRSRRIDAPMAASGSNLTSLDETSPDLVGGVIPPGKRVPRWREDHLFEPYGVSVVLTTETPYA